MIVVLLALPALTRFVTPMLGSDASGSGGGAETMVGGVVRAEEILTVLAARSGHYERRGA
jgi:hypothetical protein